MILLPGPKPADGSESLADWMELHALQSSDGCSSLADLDREFARSGVDRDQSLDDDPRDDGEALSEIRESLYEDAFNCVSLRESACGIDGYPFDVSSGSISVKAGADTSPYVFLLLVSAFGHADHIPGNPEREFEEVSAIAAAGLLGGPSETIKSQVFGFPRRLLPKDFRSSLDALCAALGEGGGCMRSPLEHEQKDAHLDVVAWRSFNDSRPSQLIIFGQCATGWNWHEKVTELDPDRFLRKWVRESLHVRPMSAFFVPHRIGYISDGERERWRLRRVDAGIILDRCRICSLLPKGYASGFAQWSESLVDKLRN